MAGGLGVREQALLTAFTHYSVRVGAAGLPELSLGL